MDGATIVGQGNIRALKLSPRPPVSGQFKTKACFICHSVQQHYLYKLLAITMHVVLLNRPLSICGADWPSLIDFSMT